MVKRLAGAATALLAAAGLSAGAAHAAYFDVTKLPKPPVTGKQIVDDNDAFATTFQGRYTGSPIELDAANFLRDEAKSLGYEANVVDFPAAANAPSGGTHAVVATRKGTTKPDESILFIGHYDQFPATVTATYDNGSGTNMLRELARSFAQVKTNRTITFAWYNGEEEGALSSGPMAKQYVAENKKVRAVLGFDMVGIAWPVSEPKAGTTCLCVWWGDGDDGFEGLLRHVNFNLLGFPDEEGKVQVVGVNDRNSDEASWDGEGYPTLRWAGMRTASSYPEYHMPGDNLDAMIASAGTRENLDAGSYNTLMSAYTTALLLDNEMPAAKAATENHGATVRFDASGSADPDGAPATFTWDFGDGATGSGPIAEHTFTKNGTFAAKLTVGDNLHQQVTDTITVPVTVAGIAGPAKVKPSCTTTARKIKNAKKRKAALKKCARAACTAKAKKIKNAKKRKAALKRCAKLK
jgi:hypothetical protein